MAIAYAHINPDILRWARERAQLSIDALARKLNTSGDTLEAWEKGEKRITIKQAKTVAEKTYVPFGYLFLKKTPEENLPIPDLRTIDGEQVRQPSAELLKIIQIVLAQQGWYQEYLNTQGTDKNSVIGRFSIKDSVSTIVEDMRFVLNVDPHPVRGNWEDYVRDLVNRIEEAGILVIRQGDLGHHSKPLSVEEFRGFAIYDEIAPVIFVNQSDVPSARLFTLIHELAHIWIGQSGVSDGNANTHRREEVLCNAVAAEFLVPGDEFLPRWNDLEDWTDNLPSLEAHFRVSTWVLARRALTFNLINNAQYNQYIAFVKRQYERLNRDRDGGPTYYMTKKSQLSERFSRALVAETLSGRVLLRDAAQLLNMKPHNINNFAKELGI
tara:strand:- start:8713 stop:9858 length:1146 start_codon:yes stop_codon:yes gene_type:complete